MSTTGMSMNDMAGTLTGYDEIAITKAFGARVDSMAAQDMSMTLGRALTFVHYRRNGLDDVAAKEAAMQMPFKEITELFPEDGEEVLPDEPETESGKDASPLA